MSTSSQQNSSKASTVGAAGRAADFIAGGLGGIALCVTAQPFDTVKVIMQAHPGRFSGPLACAKAIALQSPLGFFRGMSMPLMNIPIVNAIVFWAYGDAKRFLSSADGKNATIARGDLPVSHVLLASAYAGTINSALVGPVEMVKIQLQAQAAGHTGGHAIGGPLQFMGEAWATAGWRAALHGMAPTIGREILGYAGQFIVYEYFLQTILKHRQAAAAAPSPRETRISPSPSSLSSSTLATAPMHTEASSSAPKITITDQLIAGGLSGVVAWAVSYPLDVIKTRVQSLPVGQPLPHWAAKHRWIPDGGTISVAKHIMKTEGMAGFWRGFLPCIIPTFPGNAICFVVYELTVASFIRMGL